LFLLFFDVDGIAPHQLIIDQKVVGKNPSAHHQEKKLPSSYNTMKMEAQNHTNNNKSDGEDSAQVVKLKRDLKQSLKNNKIKTEVLNTLNKSVKLKGERLAELEAKVASNDDSKRQEAESLGDSEQWKVKAEALAAEVKTLQDKLNTKGQAKESAGPWRSKAEAMSSEILTLKYQLENETRAKQAAEQWKGKYEALSTGAKANQEKLQDKLHEESRKRLDCVENMWLQQQAHKEEMAKHQATHARELRDVEGSTDALSNEVAALKKANLSLQDSVDKAHQERDGYQASHAALKSLDQDQKEQIQKRQHEISSLQSAKAEIRRQWVSAAKKNEGMQKHITDEQARTLAELEYWKDMNERFYDSFTSNKKLLEESIEETEALKSMQDAWKLQIQDLATQLSTQQADYVQERFDLVDELQSLVRRNAHLVEQHGKLTITNEEFREQVEQAAQRIQQLEGKVDSLTVQLKPFRSVDIKRKELQESLNELEARFDHLTSQHKDSHASMQKERLAFKDTYDSLMKANQETTKQFIKARNLINTSAARFVDSEMTRQAKVLLEETAKVEDETLPAVPPELIVETPPPSDEDEIDTDVEEEEKKQEDDAISPVPVEGMDSMLSFDSTRAGTHVEDDDDDDSAISSQASDVDDDAMNIAESWFWGLVEGALREDSKEKDSTPSPHRKNETNDELKLMRLPKASLHTNILCST
jgi:chromosome segregation ATPase